METHPITQFWLNSVQTQVSIQGPIPPPTLIMETWPDACFKAYDIRGLASGNGTGELTPGFAYRLGRALATYLECDSFVVGRDIRDSSPVLAMQLMAGLAEGGVEVWDLGIVSIGCVYHA